MPLRPPVPASALLALALALFCACGGSTQPTLSGGPAIAAFDAARNVLTAGDSTTLSAEFSNGEGVIDQGLGAVSSGAPVTIRPQATTTYTLVVRSTSGARASLAVTVRVVAAPEVPVILAPASVEPGQAGLTASVAEQDGCSYRWTVNARGGSLAAGADTATVTFGTAASGKLVLSCTVSNAAGSSETSSVSFLLGGPAVASFSADPPILTAGEAAMLSFSFSGGAGVLSAPGQADLPLASTDTSASVAPEASTSYTLSVTSSGGEVYREQITVTVVPAPEILAFGATPAILGPGAVARLNAAFPVGLGTHASVDQGVGAVQSLVAVSTGTLERSTTFTLTVTNGAGRSVTASTRIQVGSLVRLAGTPSGEGSLDGASARFLHPEGAVLDLAGNLLVADTGNHTIRRLTPAGLASTLAGAEGVPGSADGVGAQARFNLPRGLALDARTGNLLVADSGNDTLRLVTPGGQVSTLAGTAGQGGSADGIGPAAGFSVPDGLAFGTEDGAEVLFVADSGNGAIRVLRLDDLAVTSRTPAGALLEPAGLAWAAVSGDLFVAEAGANRVVRVLPDGTLEPLAGDPLGAAGSADGTGGAARFDRPRGLAMDAAGTWLHVADSGNSSLRSIDPGTGAVQLLAGLPGVAGSSDSPARFAGPVGLALDGSGALFVADAGNDLIRRVSGADQTRTFAGQAGDPGSADGAGTVAEFRTPGGLALHPGSGVLYLADQGNHTIRMVSAAGTVGTLAGSAGLAGSADSSGTGPAGALFNLPADVVVDDQGRVTVADLGNHTLRRIAADGTVSTLAGSPGLAGLADSSGDGPAGARFDQPCALALGADGTLFVADRGNGAIRRVLPDGTVRTLATGFQRLSGLALAADGGTLYVADAGAATVSTLVDGQVTLLAGRAGQQGSADGTGGHALLNQPGALVVDAGGRLFVGNAGSSTIALITPEGVVTTVIGDPLHSGSAAGPLPARLAPPHGLALDSATGNIFISIDDALMKVDFTQ